MKKIFSLLIFSLIISQMTIAQESEKTGFDKSKLFFGGTLGLAFGYATAIHVAPIVGYHFSPMFAAGVGLNYSYYSYDYGYAKSKQTYAGMSLFGRFFPVQQFFIQVQPEINYLWYSEEYTSGNNQTTPLYKFNQWVPSFLLGGGTAIPTGPNGAITISVMYDVIQNVYSPYYHQAVYAFGYSMGF